MKNKKQKKIKYLLFEITQNCNLHCPYCYNTWKIAKNDKFTEELSYKNIKKIIKKLSSFVLFKSITIMGGEPLLHKELFKIAKLLYSTRAIIGLSTKAYLLDKRKIKKLIKRGISYFEISLDTIDEKLYYEITNSQKVDKVKEIITYITRYKVQCAVTIVITRLNYLYVGNVIDFCYENGVKIIVLNKFIPQGEGVANRNNLTITDKQFETLLFEVNKKNAEYKMQIGLGTPVEECKFNFKKYPYIRTSSCNYENSKIVIDPQGNLKGCELTASIIGNLLQDNAKDLLDKLEKTGCFAVYKEKCHKCDLFEKCRGGCNYLQN